MNVFNQHKEELMTAIAVKIAEIDIKCGKLTN